MSQWHDVVAAHWERAPVCTLPSPGLVSAKEVFRVLAAVSAPFRAGTRFFVLPNVSFFLRDALWPAPGELLPGSDDRNVDAYLERVGSRLSSAPFRLFVEQPLMADYPLWSAARGLMANLIERIGWPVLPIVTDVSLGNLTRSRKGLTTRIDRSAITFVLSGSMKVRLASHRSSATTTLTARTGDALYWPSFMAPVDESWTNCLAIRFSVSVHDGGVAVDTKNLTAELLPPARDEHLATPYIPFPAAPLADGSHGPLEPWVRTARALNEIVETPAHSLALRTQWVKRVSAGCLEPVPSPAAPSPLRPTDMLCPGPRGSIVRTRAGSDKWIWAVNGHAFSVSDHPVATRLLDALVSGRPRTAGELCTLASGGRKSQRNEAQALLQRIHDLRGTRRVG